MSAPHSLRRTRRVIIASALAFGAFAVGSNGAVTTQTAGAADPDPSGVSAPRGDLPGWRQIFVDDFSIDVPLGQFPGKVSDKWGAYLQGWKDTSKKGTYDPGRVVSIDNGVLSKNLRTVDGKPLVAALTPKVPGSTAFGQEYGRYEIRYRTDKIPGYKVAYLLWPDVGTVTTGAANGVGGNGEIDFPEGDLDWDRVMGFVHHQNATDGSDQAWMRAYLDIQQWHTYTIEWSPNLVVMSIDGKEIGRTTTRVPNTAMHWVLQAETSILSATPAASRGNVQIDWVAAYAYAPGTQPTAPPVTSPPATGVPDVVVDWPKQDRTVKGTIWLTTLAKAERGTTQVKWFVDGKQVGWDGVGPYWAKQWRTTTVANGRHSVLTKARASNGQWLSSKTVDFYVNN